MELDRIAAAYEADGYCFPIDVMAAEEAAACRRRLEAAEAEGAGHPPFTRDYHSHCEFLLPFVGELIRCREILDPVSRILGPDLLVWGCSFFIKAPRTPDYVSWHQDLTYWGLDRREEVTAWVALSPATVESGCMRFLPGSHRLEIQDHRDTFAAGNMLTRGQEIAVRVEESEAVDVVLRPGQMSLHHGHTFHASHPNRSAERRIGLAIRYITPAMRQAGGVKTIATLVRGEDRHGHFELAPPPDGVMTPAGIARFERAIDLLRPILYDGVA